MHEKGKDMATPASSFAPSFPHEDFQKNPTGYVLVQKQNQIFAERKGIITWLKAKLSPLISSLGSYQLPAIIETIKKIASLSPPEQSSLSSINSKIREYNVKKGTDLPLFECISSALFQPKEVAPPEEKKAVKGESQATQEAPITAVAPSITDVPGTFTETRALLISICQAGDLEMLKEFLQNDPTHDLNRPDERGVVPLSYALFFKQSTDFIRLLLAHGANPNSIDATRRPPLFHALDLGTIDAVQLLLEQGADPNATDVLGMTPLDMALFLEPPKARSMVSLLLHKNADPNAFDGRHFAPLALAVIRRQWGCVVALLRGGADPDGTDGKKLSPMRYAEICKRSLPPKLIPLLQRYRRHAYTKREK